MAGAGENSAIPIRAAGAGQGTWTGQPYEGGGEEGRGEPAESRVLGWYNRLSAFLPPLRFAFHSGPRLFFL